MPLKAPDKPSYNALKSLGLLARSLADLLLPPACPICDELLDYSTEYICQTCRFGFDEFEPGSDRLGQPAIDSLHSAFFFGGSLQQGIIKLKLAGRRELAPYLARQLFATILADWNWAKIDMLVAVPLHKNKLYKRGFNQSALLAREISSLSDCRFSAGILRRIRNTPSQSSVGDPSSRSLNVKGAFDVKPKTNLKNRCVCLVDDVVTTGATLSECARTLRKAGAAEVHALTVARSV